MLTNLPNLINNEIYKFAYFSNKKTRHKLPVNIKGNICQKISKSNKLSRLIIELYHPHCFNRIGGYTLGYIGTGKTVCSHKYLSGQYQPNFPPSADVQVSFKNVEIMKNKIKLQVWDFPGQIKYRSLVSLQLCKLKFPKVFIVFYDVTQRNSFDKIQEIIKLCNDKNNLKSLIIVGNKSDCYGARVVFPEQGLSLALKYNAIYLQSNSKQGVSEIFTKAIELKICQFGLTQIQNGSYFEKLRQKIKLVQQEISEIYQSKSALYQVQCFLREKINALQVDQNNLISSVSYYPFWLEKKCQQISNLTNYLREKQQSRKILKIILNEVQKIKNNQKSQIFKNENYEIMFEKSCVQKQAALSDMMENVRKNQKKLSENLQFILFDFKDNLQKSKALEIITLQAKLNEQLEDLQKVIVIVFSKQQRIRTQQYGEDQDDISNTKISKEQTLKILTLQVHIRQFIKAIKLLNQPIFKVCQDLKQINKIYQKVIQQAETVINDKEHQVLQQSYKNMISQLIGSNFQMLSYELLRVPFASLKKQKIENIRNILEKGKKETASIKQTFKLIEEVIYNFSHLLTKSKLQIKNKLKIERQNLQIMKNNAQIFQLQFTQYLSQRKQ